MHANPQTALDTAVRNKLDRALELIASYGSVVVAYSGGVDSTLVLKMAQEAVAERVLAVTACSVTYPESEGTHAGELARTMGVRHEFIYTDELADERFVRNDAQRCYWCKRELFRRLRQYAERNGYGQVIDGASAEDTADYRPGSRAAVELGVQSPLRQAGFLKADIRSVSRWYGLPTWNKPALACFSSRIPYGTPIEPEIVARIAAAEAAVREICPRITQLRVRHHGDIARIEVLPEEIPQIMSPDRRGLITARLQATGYIYVTVDLAGYRTGSMNAVLPETVRNAGIGPSEESESCPRAEE